jgi:hypothetical protein
LISSGIGSRLRNRDFVGPLRDGISSTAGCKRDAPMNASKFTGETKARGTKEEEWEWIFARFSV